MKNSALRVAQLVMMLSSDRPQGMLDALYVPGLSLGMLEASSILAYAADMHAKGCAPVIAFNGSDGEAFDNQAQASAWPGKDFYIREFMAHGVPEDLLIATGSAMHSREEMEELVATAKHRSWQRIGIVTIPYHYARTFSYLPGAFALHGWQPDVFALNPPKTDWYLSMGASQGKGYTTPENAAYDDVAKVLDHIKRGWAAPLDDVFAYLRSRVR